MISLADWIAFYIALFETVVQWLGSMQIMSVPVLGIMAAVFIMCVIFKSMLYKP